MARDTDRGSSLRIVNSPCRALAGADGNALVLDVVIKSHFVVDLCFLLRFVNVVKVALVDPNVTSQARRERLKRSGHCGVVVEYSTSLYSKSDVPSYICWAYIPPRDINCSLHIHCTDKRLPADYRTKRYKGPLHPNVGSSF